MSTIIIFKKTSFKYLMSISLFIFHSSFLFAQSWPPLGMLGDGTSGNPWQITDSSHLRILADYVNASKANSLSTDGKYYILINDIDLSGYNNWQPIGGFLDINSHRSSFSGNFDGNGKVVNNLTINRPSEDNMGLFGIVSSVIKDLGVVNCSVVGKTYVGGLAGCALHISNCYVTGNVSGSGITSVGVGGLVGSIGTIGSASNLSNCYFIGNVENSSYVGGVVGMAFGTIFDCYAIGSVSGYDCVGGLIGRSFGYVQGEEENYPCLISNCYAINSVRGTDYVGGLVGQMRDNYGMVIRNCIVANDSVIGGNPSYQPQYVNRIVGNTHHPLPVASVAGTLQNNYALNTMVVQANGSNVPITSHLDSVSGFSIPMDSLKSFAFYDRAANWYQMPWSIQNPLGIWKICDKQDLPFLRWQGIICGDTIIATAGTNGTISPNGTVIVDEGNDQTFTFSADNCYEVDSLWIDSVYFPDSITMGSYTFNNITKNHTIEVSFKRLPPDTVTICDTICYGINYTQNGFSITNAATDSVYFNNDFNTNGCDSVTRLELTVNPLIITPISDSICEGDFYNFRGDSLTASGIYYDTLPAIFGCDSIIELTLTVISVDTTQITVDICEGESYDFFGRQLTEEGIYYKTLQTIHGCDSVIELTLTVEGVGVVEARHATSLRIYPNPTDGKLHITYAETLHATSVQIFDVVGRKYNVEAKHVLPNEEIEIDISHLAAGMYFLRIDGKVFKVVKQ